MGYVVWLQLLLEKNSIMALHTGLLIDNCWYLKYQIAFNFSRISSNFHSQNTESGDRTPGGGSDS